MIYHERNVELFNLTENYKNDCWNHTLAYALNKPYEEVREMCKPFITITGDNVGGLPTGILEAILESNKYGRINLNEYTLLDVIKTFDTWNNKVIVLLDHHVVYVNHNVVYSAHGKNIHSFGNMLYKNVECMYYKYNEDLEEEAK